MSSHGDASVRPPEQGQLTAGQVRFLIGAVAPELDVRAAAGTPYGRISPTALQVRADGSVQLSTAPNALDADAHAAPEVLSGGGEPTVRSEVFSLASTSYTLLTGHPPNPYGFATVRRARPDLDPRVDGVLAQATARGPEFRFPTVTAFAEALGAALGVPVEPIRPVPAPTDTGSWAAPAAAPPGTPAFGRPALAPMSGPMPAITPPRQRAGSRFEVSETALSITLLLLVILVGMGCLSLFLIV